MSNENEKLIEKPAFPFFKENEIGYGDTIVVDNQFGVKAFYPFEKGMSKRFYAACAAMQGILANRALIDNNGDSEIEWVVFTAYKAADEMLKQEEK